MKASPPLDFAMTLLCHMADGQVHSGQQLAQVFTCSRSKIWLAIKSLQALGLGVICVRGKGYQLQQTLDLIDAKCVAQHYPLHPYTIETHAVLDSTNTYLMQKPDAAHQLCVVAAHQTAGRGRFGRTWLSLPHASLTFSVNWCFSKPISALSGLSLVVGLALARALQSLGLKGVGLKWANDVFVEGKKCGGILLEGQGDLNGPCRVVIGIGLNLALPDSLAQQIDQAAGAVSCPQGRNALLAACLKMLSDYLPQLEQHGFALFVDDFNALHIYHQQEVVIGDVEGVVLGVNPDGALRIDVGGAEKIFYAGEVSVRPALRVPLKIQSSK